MSNEFPIGAHFPTSSTSQHPVSNSTEGQISSYFSSSTDNEKENLFTLIGSTQPPPAVTQAQQPRDSHLPGTGVNLHPQTVLAPLDSSSPQMANSDNESRVGDNPGLFSHGGPQNSSSSSGFFGSLSSQGQLPDASSWGAKNSSSVQQQPYGGNPADSAEHLKSHFTVGHRSQGSASSFFVGSNTQEGDFFSSLQPQSLPMMPSHTSTVLPSHAPSGKCTSAPTTGVLQILQPSSDRPYETQLSSECLSGHHSLPSNADSNLSSPLSRPHSNAEINTHPFGDPFFGQPTNADPKYCPSGSHTGGLQTNADPDYNSSKYRGPLTNLEREACPVEKKQSGIVGSEPYPPQPLGSEGESNLLARTSCAVETIERPPSAASSLNQSLCSLLDSQEDFTSGASPIRLVAPAPFTHEPLPPVGPAVSLTGEVRLGGELSLLPPAPLPSLASNTQTDVTSSSGKTTHTTTDSVAIVEEVRHRSELGRAMSDQRTQVGTESGHGGFDQYRTSRQNRATSSHGTEHLLAEASADEDTPGAGEKEGSKEEGSASPVVVGENGGVNLDVRPSPDCSERSLNDWEIVDSVAEQRTQGVGLTPDLVHPTSGFNQPLQQHSTASEDLFGPHGLPAEAQWQQNVNGPPPQFQAPDVVSQSSSLPPDLPKWLTVCPPDVEVIQGHPPVTVNPSPSIGCLAGTSAPSGSSLPQVVQATLSPEDFSLTSSSDRTLVGLSPSSTSQPSVIETSQNLSPATVMSPLNQSHTSPPSQEPITLSTHPSTADPQQGSQSGNFTSPLLHAQPMHDVSRVGLASQSGVSSSLLYSPPVQNPQHGSQAANPAGQTQPFGTGMSLNPQNAQTNLGNGEVKDHLGIAGAINRGVTCSQAVPLAGDPQTSSNADSEPSVNAPWSENPLPNSTGSLIAPPSVPMMKPPLVSGVDLLPQTGLHMAPSSSVVPSTHSQVGPPQTGSPADTSSMALPTQSQVRNAATELQTGLPSSVFPTQPQGVSAASQLQTGLPSSMPPPAQPQVPSSASQVQTGLPSSVPPPTQPQGLDAATMLNSTPPQVPRAASQLQTSTLSSIPPLTQAQHPDAVAQLRCLLLKPRSQVQLLNFKLTCQAPWQLLLNLKVKAQPTNFKLAC